MQSFSSAGSVRHHLRDATASRHASVDQLFGQFDLSRRDDYAALLLAHARAVPALEAAADPASLYADWFPRTPLIRADLAGLGEDMPESLTFVAENEAERWGIFYVMEGSKLGGAMLARSVAPGLPHAYLSAGHGPGEWRAFQRALEDAAHDDGWIDGAVRGADRAFSLFEAAAR